MATIDNGFLQDILDSLAAQYRLLIDTLGDGTEGEETVSAGALSIRTGLLDTEDNDQVRDMRTGFDETYEKAKYRSSSAQAGNTAANILKGDLDAINRHLSGAFVDTITDAGILVHPDFAELYFDIYKSRLARALIFPAVTTIGTLARGESTTAYTHVAGVSEYHGPGQMEVEVLAEIGAANWVLTLTCETLAGEDEEKVVTIPSGSLVGAKIAVGTAGNKYVDVTDVEATGGTSGDAARIQPILLRDPELHCPLPSA